MMPVIKKYPVANPKTQVLGPQRLRALLDFSQGFAILGSAGEQKTFVKGLKLCYNTARWSKFALMGSP
jgi:hypothetical protein